ncbi:MAG TPA: hypothetical protein VJK30_02855 [Coxiellaceae bacterium]|nr:MAG: hypothetical protein A3E81_02855 [Gammaproteobacteria bacterium RIFCSPHIGHO2_12_FULL_36_30]HLB56255.1 hypothetical protein [Coxiellaceae bacterium]
MKKIIGALCISLLTTLAFSSYGALPGGAGATVQIHGVGKNNVTGTILITTNFGAPSGIVKQGSASVTAPSQGMTSGYVSGVNIKLQDPKGNKYFCAYLPNNKEATWYNFTVKMPLKNPVNGTCTLCTLPNC